jgi:hypothetical protein
MESLFLFDNDRYHPSRYTFAGWNNGTLHGSPIAALLAHAIEKERPDDAMLLARLTVDLPRPIRQAPLRVATETIREGRRIKLVDARLHDGDTLVARASGLLLRRDGSGPGDTTLPAVDAIPRWDLVPPRHWEDGPPNPLGDDPGGATQYYRSVEVRRLTDPGDGPFRAWVRVPFELLPGTPLSPAVQAAAIADFASATGMLSRGRWKPFINPDITLTLHRPPRGEWMCLDAASRGDADGIASSSINLHDAAGLFGHSVVTGLSNPQPVGAAARGEAGSSRRMPPQAQQPRTATIEAPRQREQ